MTEQPTRYTVFCCPECGFRRIEGSFGGIPDCTHSIQTQEVIDASAYEALLAERDALKEERGAKAELIVDLNDLKNAAEARVKELEGALKEIVDQTAASPARLRFLADRALKGEA